MPRIRYTRLAEADLLDLWLTIAEENPLAADSTLDSIQKTVSLLGSQPEMGRVRGELSDGLRSFPTRTPTSSSICQIRKVCLLFGCCIMPVILTLSIFPNPAN